MKTNGNKTSPAPDDGENKGKALAGTQTLVRGLEVIEAIAAGSNTLARLEQTLDLTRSTLHRLASTLVELRYLTFTPRVGYALGPKMMELGFLASQQSSLQRVARDHLEQLAADVGDTVHLGVLDGMRALYLDKISGRRRIEISSRIGERQPLRSTGLGKALILDDDETQWRAYYKYEDERGQRYGVDLNEWLHRMRQYAADGYAFDIEENEDRIRCVAAPIRDASGRIIASLSVSSAAQYMNDERMVRLAGDIKGTAEAISRELGWTPAGRADAASP